MSVKGEWGARLGWADWGRRGRERPGSARHTPAPGWSEPEPGCQAGASR